MLTNEQRRKAKRKLYALSDEGERADIVMREMEEVQDKFAELHTAISDKKDVSLLVSSLTKDLALMRAAYKQSMTTMTDSLKEGHDAFLKNVKEMHETLKKNAPKDSSGFFKDLGTLLAEGNQHSKKTSDLITNLKWNSSMQVRNENGSPMTPYGVSPKVQDGTTTVVTSGTAVQLSTTSIPCYGVYVVAHESNTGTVLVGDTTVVAALAGRRGYSLYPTNSQKFSVTNVNFLYVDSTVSGDKVHWYVERQF